MRASTRQQNVSVAPAHGLLHDVRVEDEVVADLSAQVADFLDDDGASPCAMPQRENEDLRTTQTPSISILHKP